MSKDISTCYTKEQNIRCGRKGYYEENVISPRDYGMFLLILRKRGKGYGLSRSK